MCGRLMSHDGDDGRALLRLFVAIELPKPVKNEVLRIQNELKAINLLTGTFTNYENAHFTLQFLGYVEQGLLSTVKKSLRDVSFDAIEAHVGQIGIFQDQGVVNVIWLGIIGDGIISLAENIASSLGYSFQHDKFVPHITLVRVKSAKNDLLVEELDKIEVDHIPFTISEFVLKQSILGDYGAVYIDIEKYSAK